jgi:hypothetical protein
MTEPQNRLRNSWSNAIGCEEFGACLCGPGSHTASHARSPEASLQRASYALASRSFPVRNINIAYKVVAASVGASEPGQDPPPDPQPGPVPRDAPPSVARPHVNRTSGTTEEPFRVSPQDLDAIIESINRAGGRFNFPGKISFERWLSLVFLVADLAVVSAPNPLSMLRSGTIVWALLVLVIPVGFVWHAGELKGLDRWPWRLLGWFLLMLPVLLYFFAPVFLY